VTPEMQAVTNKLWADEMQRETMEISA